MHEEYIANLAYIYNFKVWNSKLKKTGTVKICHAFAQTNNLFYLILALSKVISSVPDHHNSNNPDSKQHC